MDIINDYITENFNNVTSIKLGITKIINLEKFLVEKELLNKLDISNLIDSNKEIYDLIYNYHVKF